MARARTSGGGTAALWALVIFGAGFVVCLVLTILFYTQRLDAEEAADSAQSDLRQYVSAELENDPAVQARLGEPGPVVGQLLEENRLMRSLAGVDEEADQEQIMQRLQELGVDGDLLGVIERLQGELASQEQRVARLEEDLEEERQRVQAQRDRADDRSQRYEDALAELESELEQVRQSFEDYRDRVQQVGEELTAQVQQARAEGVEDREAVEQQLGELELERDSLQARIQELTRREALMEPPMVARADGEIVNVRPDRRQVRINRGGNDRVIVGMTFEVFARDELPELEDDTGQRGKATIEIFEVRDGDALGRVVRQRPGTSLSPGDSIVNLVYDADFEFTFYVFGEFDLDGDGYPREGDRRRVESLIRNWGGRVMDELNYEVDYVVLGYAPPLPAEPPDEEVDPDRLRAFAEAEQLYDQYRQIVRQAQELGIPVLNQNRFLALVGYHGR